MLNNPHSQPPVDSITDPATNPPAKFTDEPPGKPSKKAQKEFADLFGEKQKVLHRVFIVAIQSAAAILGAVLVIRIYHMVMPYSCQWLCDFQLQALDKFLFSGVIGALIGRHFDSAFKVKD